MALQKDRPLRILRLPEVKEKTGLGKSRIQSLEAKGLFPKRIKISERASGWVESEVDAYIASRIALRDAAPASSLAVAAGSA